MAIVRARRGQIDLMMGKTEDVLRWLRLWKMVSGPGEELILSRRLFACQRIWDQVSGRRGANPNFRCPDLVKPLADRILAVVRIDVMRTPC